MNAQIKRLLEQSGLQPYYDSQQGDIEKFAELLLHDVLSQNILQAQRVDKDPVCQNYPKEVIAGFFYADMMKRYGVEK